MSNPIAHALRLAQQAMYLSQPNPRVGCVITQTGSVIGQGFTQPRGHAHAEIMALRDVVRQGLSARGATAYVTLEPCAHHGRTPPCCHALIESGIAKVVVAILDPNPLVAGKGVQALRDAGVEVQVLPPDSTDAVAAYELNIGFLKRMLHQRPWVRMKIAASLDGQTALANGVSQWITSDAARLDGQAWRARASAVLTGIGTILQDDPLLNVRDIATPRQPHLVIVDSQLQTPLNAKLWSTAGCGYQGPNTFNVSAEVLATIERRAVWIYTAVENSGKTNALQALGAQVIYLPKKDELKVDLQAMMQDLALREINELHVEAGAKLNASLIQEKLVDDLLIYTAAKVLGPGRGMFDLPGLTSLAQGVGFNFQSVDLMGEDLRTIARIR
jgi:diaminohydroxyphosphoribosylaminopyrimidine deaminase / 5-amino-6-(5-phosphoribosylamino)uracil reductase